MGQGQQHPLREHQTAQLVQIAGDGVGIQHQFVDDVGQAGQGEIQGDGGVGGDHPFHRRMRDVAFVPQGDVFQGGDHHAADDAGQAGQVFGQHRIALVRHGRAALLARREIFLGLAHFGALQMADFDGHPFHRTGDDAQGGEELGVTVARDHLGGNGFGLQAHLARHPFLDEGVHIGEGADRTRYGAGGHFGPGRQQAGAVALEFRMERGEFQADGHRLGMDAVAAAHAGQVLGFKGAAGQSA